MLLKGSKQKTLATKDLQPRIAQITRIPFRLSVKSVVNTQRWSWSAAVRSRTTQDSPGWRTIKGQIGERSRQRRQKNRWQKGFSEGRGSSHHRCPAVCPSV